MSVERITLAPGRNGQWAVKHGEGYLGVANGREEAMAIGRGLVDWLVEHGREAELYVEPSSASKR
jgi:hypothetical protein